jgi:hypothetical protein
MKARKRTIYGMKVFATDNAVTLTPAVSNDFILVVEKNKLNKIDIVYFSSQKR